MRTRVTWIIPRSCVPDTEVTSHCRARKVLTGEGRIVPLKEYSNAPWQFTEWPTRVTLWSSTWALQREDRIRVHAAAQRLRKPSGAHQNMVQICASRSPKSTLEKNVRRRRQVDAELVCCFDDDTVCHSDQPIAISPSRSYFVRKRLRYGSLLPKTRSAPGPGARIPHLRRHTKGRAKLNTCDRLRR